MSVNLLNQIKTDLICQWNEGGGLPPGPSEIQWTLGLDQGLAYFVVADDGIHTHYCWRYRLNGGAFTEGPLPVLLGESITGIGAADDLVEAQVRWCDGAGTPLSEWSAIKSITNEDQCFLDGATPATITSAITERGVGIDTYRVGITWSTPNDGIVATQQLMRALTINGSYAAASAEVGPGVNAAADDGTVNGVVPPEFTFFYKVLTVYNTACPDTLSDPVQVDTGCLAEAPTNTAQDGAFSDQIQVQWTAPSALPILDFLIQWGTSPGVYTDFDTTANSETTYIIEGLTPDTPYYVRVSARDTGTCTAPDNEVEMFTDP